MDGEAGSSCGSFTFEDKEFIVKRGDYSPLMEKVCHYLQEAQVRWEETARHNLTGFLFLFWVFGSNKNKIILDVEIKIK